MRFSTNAAVSLSLITAVTAVPLCDKPAQWRSVDRSTSSSWTVVAHDAFKSVAAAIGWYDLPAMESVSHSIAETTLLPGGGDNDKSVYQWLKQTDKFSNITKLIEYDEEIVKLLDESSHGLTFFAPNNDAFPKRKHDDESLEQALLNSQEDLLATLLHHGDSILGTSSKSGEDDDKKKKIFKKILHDVLLYHTLSISATIESVNKNFTLPTEYAADDDSYGGQYRRIKIEHTLVPPSTKLNKYVKVVNSDYKGTNGVVHEIDHILLPPPAIFDVAFMLPKYFSTFTSAVQKVGLDKVVKYEYNRDSKKFEGTPVVTAFVPSNDAFSKLPPKLALFLFSPFGERVLAKLLAFHVVPDFIVHSEWVYNYKDKKKVDLVGVQENVEFKFDFPFVTALGKNYTLPVHIKKTTPTIPVPGLAYVEFSVQDQSLDYTDIDLVARNGVLHIVPSVLIPPHHHQEEDGSWSVRSDSWNGWEEWLPQWAAEQ